MKKLIFVLNFLSFTSIFCQDGFEKSDFWNVIHYDILVQPDFTTKGVLGSNKIQFEFTKKCINPTFVIDLHEPMRYSFLSTDLGKINHERKGDRIFIHANGEFQKGKSYYFKIAYEGNPKSVNRYESPWKNGWVFTQDELGHPFMSVAQEHDGVSLWLPTKDVWYDEPEEGITMQIITPKDLVGVGNGRLINYREEENYDVYTWEVKSSINPYSIVPNVGKYVHFKDEFFGEKGKLDLDYWVLEGNLEKAKKQFQQVKPMLSIFEYWFGAYPFYEDSYKMVETPYLGMEHQSNVAYGNGYKNGYKGTDLSGTGVGLLWDFIIVHETGHEWFANNITAKDMADMWIHESFTCYSETLFVEKYLDKPSAERYVQGIRKNILNDKPIIGIAYGVRKTGSGDMYYKGANMLHTIRMVIHNDRVFKTILRGLNKRFYHQTVTTQQVEDYISKQSGIDFKSVFNQYLRTTKIPVLEYQQNGRELRYRYTNVVDEFNLPIRINNKLELYPTEDWQNCTLRSSEKIEWNKNYYIEYKEVH